MNSIKDLTGKSGITTANLVEAMIALLNSAGDEYYEGLAIAGFEVEAVDTVGQQHGSEIAYLVDGELFVFDWDGQNDTWSLGDAEGREVCK